MLDQCLDRGAISIEGDQLTLEKISSLPWTLHPAVLVTELDGEAQATQEAKDLVGQVRTSEELDALGAEHFGTAVVVGELAYTVRPGFVMHCSELAIPGAPSVVDVLQEWDKLFESLPPVSA